jgi:hypothetical protein
LAGQQPGERGLQLIIVLAVGPGQHPGGGPVDRDRVGARVVRGAGCHEHLHRRGAQQPVGHLLPEVGRRRHLAEPLAYLAHEEVLVTRSGAVRPNHASGPAAEAGGGGALRWY